MKLKLKLKRSISEQSLPFVIGVIWLMPTIGVIFTPYAAFGYLCSYFITREIIFEE